MGLTVGRLLEGDAGGPFTRASQLFARGVRNPQGRRPSTQHAVHGLRTIATSLSALGHLESGETSNAIILAGHLAHIIETLTDIGPAAGRRARAQAVTGYRQFVAEQTHRQAGAVLAALGEPMTTRILAEPAWPALAVRMAKMEARGFNVPDALLKVATSRELDSVDSLAKILHYRLGRAGVQATPTGPDVVPASKHYARPRPHSRGAS